MSNMTINICFYFMEFCVVFLTFLCLQVERSYCIKLFYITTEPKFKSGFLHIDLNFLELHLYPRKSSIEPVLTLKSCLPQSFTSFLIFLEMYAHFPMLKPILTLYSKLFFESK